MGNEGGRQEFHNEFWLGNILESIHLDQSRDGRFIP
jgi:hypothetical protein